MASTIFFLAGMLVGIIITAIYIACSHLVGTLRIDRSNLDDQPYMFLELSKGVKSILSKKYVILTVNFKNFVSHK